MTIMNAKELANFIGGEVIGNPMEEVDEPGYLFAAKRNQLAYCFLKDEKRDLEAISRTAAGIVICQENLKAKIQQMKNKPTLILSKTPKYDFAKVLQEYFEHRTPAISSLAHIGSDVKIGDDVDIHSNVIIYDNTVIGNRVTIRANTVLGAEGLDYGKNQQGELKRIPHLSQLIIGDDVDIGSNTTVQKGILRPTYIGKGTKIGPNCDIGHEVRIGEHCIITGMTLVAGATQIGDYTFIAPHSTIKNSIKIGNNVFVGIGSLVIGDVPNGATIVGAPAIELVEFKKRRKKLAELLGDP